MNYVVNQTNFKEFVRALLTGERKANVRMSEYIPESEELFAEYMSEALLELVLRIRQAGYCSVEILSPLLKEYDGWLSSNPRTDLKNKIDNEFSIDMTDYAAAIDYSTKVYNKQRSAS